MVAAASKKEPNPFTENKRDAILKFYRPSDKDYAFVYARFYTVTRPSEAVALKWGRVDLLNGKRQSFYPGHSAKRMRLRAKSSVRTITFLPNVVGRSAKNASPAARRRLTTTFLPMT